MSDRIRTVVDGIEIEVEESSGNVFADLELPDPEERLAKAILSRQIDKEIQARGMTQAQAAELLGITQPDVSNIVRGRLSGWSLERLTRLLNRLSWDVEITVRPAEDGEQGHLRVRVA
ncbi:MAG: XRE family transcriptional regulator [Gemmatimonadetes bacterium]|jgi:predicted XRE-type DNA-binding protein|nr:XRE family transcriptional regulator [Gemmatimonadota bacterium]